MKYALATLVIILLISMVQSDSECISVTSQYGQDNATLPYFTCASPSSDVNVVDIRINQALHSAERTEYLFTPTFSYWPERSYLTKHRFVNVAAILLGSAGHWKNATDRAREKLDVVGKQGTDIAVLSEEFAGLDSPEEIPNQPNSDCTGPVCSMCSEYAAKYKMYVVCPVREVEKNRLFNTAAMIGRNGKVLGKYRKVYTVCYTRPCRELDDTTKGLTPSHDGVQIFDLDFGRVGILICFDINFGELWSQLDAAKVDMVLWPSAYGGGYLLNSYAQQYQYYIVPAGWGNIIDISGHNLTPGCNDNECSYNSVFTATLDLDRTIVQTWDENFFTNGNYTKMLAENPDIVIESNYPSAGWVLLKSKRDSVLVKDVMKKYNVNSIQEYRHWAVRGVNQVRASGKAMVSQMVGAPTYQA